MQVQDSSEDVLVQAGEVQDAVSLLLVALVALPLLALALLVLVVAAAVHGRVAVLVGVALVPSLCGCVVFVFLLLLVLVLVVVIGSAHGTLLAPDLDRLSTAADHPAGDVEAQPNDAFLGQLVVLQLGNDSVLTDLDKAQVAIAQADSGNLAAGADTGRQQGKRVEALGASLGAVDGDALILVVPDAALPEREHAVASADQHLLAHVGALLGQARDDDGAQQLFLLVLGAHHDAPPQVGHGECAAAGGDPLLAEAARACFGGRQGREGGDVVVVGAVRGLWGGRLVGAEGADVVDVQRGRVGCEDEGLRGEGVDERGGVDGGVGTAAVSVSGLW